MRLRRPLPPLPAPRATAGFSLVELAVVLSVLGLLTMTALSAFDNLGQVRQHNAARAHGEAARQAVLAFALRNKRLPCPDTSANGDAGREGGGMGCGGAPSIGWLPYESLGLDLPVRSARLRYGVYRPLTAATAHSADQPDLERIGGFGNVLAALAAATSADTSQPHYAGDGTAATCTGAGAQVSNPAFVLVAPAGDRDGIGGTGFDGPHRNFAAGGSACVLPPDTPTSTDYDDVVVVQSPSTLLGWLMTVTR